MRRHQLLTVVAGIAIFSLAIGATRASAQATVIAKCTAITNPGSYVLTKNLTASGDCLVVEASFVTIDLFGHVITGDGTGKGVSSVDDALTGIVVRNGTITNFNRGIDLLGPESVIERMLLIGNAGSGLVVAPVSIVRDNVVTRNGGDGIKASSQSLVTGNVVFGNGGTGIGAFIISVVTGNTTSGNGGHGIAAAEGSTISNNAVQANGVTGVITTCPSVVINNSANANPVNISTAGSGCVLDHNATGP